MNHGQSQWRLANSKRHFLDRAAAQPGQAILLATGAELADQAWRSRATSNLLHGLAVWFELSSEAGVG